MTNAVFEMLHAGKQIIVNGFSLIHLIKLANPNCKKRCNPIYHIFSRYNTPLYLKLQQF